MTVEITDLKLKRFKSTIEDAFKDELFCKDHIAKGCDPTNDALMIIRATSRRKGAEEILNALGIGVEYDFENASASFYKLGSGDVL